MAISGLTIESRGGNSYVLSWTSDSEDPTFYIYDLSAGRKLAETKLTEIAITLEPGESVVIDVRESELSPVPRGHPGRLTLFWYAATPADVAHYRAEEYVSAAWTLRARIYPRGEGSFHWKTRFLEDVTTHQFRVIPVGTNGNQGTAKTWSVLMVRYPDEPDVDFTFNAAGDTVTVSAS